MWRSHADHTGVHLTVRHRTMPQPTMHYVCLVLMLMLVLVLVLVLVLEVLMRWQHHARHHRR